MKMAGARNAAVGHGLAAIGAVACILLMPVCAYAADGGVARARVQRDGAVLENSSISLRMDAKLSQLVVGAPGLGRSVPMRGAFLLKLQDGTELAPAEMQVVAPLHVEDLKPDAGASRLSSRVAGKAVCTDLAMSAERGTVHWCALLRDGSAYVRQEVTITAGAAPVPISQVVLLQFGDSDAQVQGSVKGSPVADGTMYFGFEDPLSKAEIQNGVVTASVSRTLPLQAGKSISYSSVIGAAPKGQLRRAFLAYVERERAHPYRTFLHYNTWYDLGFGERFDEAGALDRVHAFGEELMRKRGVVMDSFLFDDGWDDEKSVWGMNSGFPQGFTRVADAAKSYGFGIGVWLSPWGGYDEAKQSRVAVGRQQGYEIVRDGFALSGPRYYERFEQTCLAMIRRYGVNQFKFDGTGNASRVFPGSLFDSDFDAAIHLIQRLREESPSLYVNLTTGTYASPFWLRYADSIWRGGEDHSFAGVGTWRQKWITYRDGQTYENIVLRGPLFPLNSLMLHGLIYAKHAQHLGDDPGDDFADEVHTYFGSGTQLQEMYITPSLLTEKNWDVLAESARWSRANAEVLRDSHWVGGNPDALQVYGWAAWNGGRGVLVLRNPSGRSQEIRIDVAKVFELPAGAGRAYAMKSPWKADAAIAATHLRAGEEHTFALKPFEVLTLESN